MEFNSVIYFEHDNGEFVNGLEDLPNEESDLDLSNFELEYKSPKATISFSGGYETEIDTQSIMNYLREKGAKKVYGYTVGDEDPYISLHLADEEGILAYTLDPAIYEHIAECGPEDIEDSEELQTARAEGPRVFFSEQLNEWKAGLSGRDITLVEEMVESIIGSAESTIQ